MNMIVKLPTQIAIRSGMSLDEYKQLFALIQDARQALHWALGDALVRGEHEHGDSIYDYAISATGFAYSTLTTDRSVAMKYPPERRRRELSFAHHAEIASLEPEVCDALLDRAVRDELTVQDMREFRKNVRLPEPPEEEFDDDGEVYFDTTPEPKTILGHLNGVEVPNENISSDIVLADRDILPAIKEIKRIKKQVKEWSKSHSCFVGFSASQRLVADLENAARQLTKALPHAVCPHCRGEGCDYCKKRGWINQLEYKALSEEQKGSL